MSVSCVELFGQFCLPMNGAAGFGMFELTAGKAVDFVELSVIYWNLCRIRLC